MADNTILDAGAGDGDTLRTEDRTTYKTPVSLIDVGGVTSEALIGDAGNYMPVAFEVATAAQVGAGTEASTLRVTLPTDGTGIIAGVTTVTTVTTCGTVTNLAQLGGQAVSMGTGVRDAGTQRVTVATDDSHAVTNAGTFAVQVDAALPAGTNAIGKLAANDGVDIGDVDVTSVVPGTGATNLGKAVGDAAGATDTGTTPLAVRDDDLSSLSDPEGDYVPLRVDSTGALHTTGGTDEFAFQTTATLANGASYDSGILTLSPKFSQVQTSVSASHDGTITITWYTDSGGTNLVRTLTIPYTAASGFQMFGAPAFTPYNKYVFTNDSGSNQTDFHFDTKFLRHAISPQTLRVDGPIANGMVANLGRSVISANNGSSWVNVAATTAGNLKMSVQEISDGLDIGAGNAGAETARVSISTDDVNLSAIKTAVEVIDNAISGTEMQVDVVTQPARDNATDTITASLDSAAIMNDTTALTPKFAAINATTNGDNTIVAAVVGKKVRVLSYSIVADAAVGIAFEDGAGGTELSGQMAFAANGGITVPFSPVGHFETTANTLLNLETDAVANVRGHVCYVEV